MSREGRFKLRSKFGHFRGNKQAVKGWEKRKAGFLCDSTNAPGNNNFHISKHKANNWSDVVEYDSASQSDENIDIETIPESMPIIEEECTSSDEVLLIEDDELCEQNLQASPTASPVIIGSFPCSNPKIDTPVVISSEVKTAVDCSKPSKKRRRLAPNTSHWSPLIESLTCTETQAETANLVVEEVVTDEESFTPKKKCEDEDPLQITCDNSPGEVLKTVKSRPSDWLKTLAWNLESAKKEDSCAAGMQSTTKIKRYPRASLAHRWQQVVAREQAAIAIWRHELNSAKRQKADMLRVHLRTVRREYSVFVAICKLLSGSIASEEGKRKSLSLSGPQILPPEISQRSSDSREQIVIFPSQRTQRWLPRSGCIVKIYAPWKLINVGNCADPVLLCTYFEEEKSSSDAAATAGPQMRCIFKWRCSCLTDEDGSPKFVICSNCNDCTC